ncbi:MAG: hypothetical protein IJC56_00975 [Clostridia bacterium]|nr:hypothetical protein [Clostridia bacterium]
MARKRITEEDLLAFRAQADEIHQELEVKFEKMERAKKTQEELEERDIGLLILRGADVDMAAMRKFGNAAWNNGYSYEVVDLSESPVDHNPKERIPAWQRALDKAQLGYLKLGERAKHIIVIGTGVTAAAATVITEQYPVDALVIVGEGPATKTFAKDRVTARMASIAKNNLFSIVCPVYIIAPEITGDYKPGSSSMFEESSRSDDVRVEHISGMSAAQIWTEREQDMEKRIFGFLREFSD